MRSLPSIDGRNGDNFHRHDISRPEEGTGNRNPGNSHVRLGGKSTKTTLDGYEHSQLVYHIAHNCTAELTRRKPPPKLPNLGGHSTIYDGELQAEVVFRQVVPEHFDV